MRSSTGGDRRTTQRSAILPSRALYSFPSVVVYRGASQPRPRWVVDTVGGPGTGGGSPMSHTTRLGFVTLVVLSASVFAGDWPQWAGPNRDFTAPGAELADRWPEQGPPRLWSRELGVGYSGIVAAGDLLYTMYRKSRTDPDEYTVALDAETGKTVWEFKNPAPLVGPPAEPSDTRQRQAPVEAGPGRGIRSDLRRPQEQRHRVRGQPDRLRQRGHRTSWAQKGPRSHAGAIVDRTRSGRRKSPLEGSGLR